MQEALRLLGIRPASLTWLEGFVGISRNSRRTGYTSEEIERLLSALQLAFHGKYQEWPGVPRTLKSRKISNATDDL